MIDNIEYVSNQNIELTKTLTSNMSLDYTGQSLGVLRQLIIN